MQSQWTDLEQSRLIHLECPVCLEYVRHPVTLCANGYKICKICKKEVGHCPSCTQQFVKTRNLAIEDLARHVKYPCKYRAYGCTDILHRDKTGGHQAKCRYSPQVCSVAELAIWNCSWTEVTALSRVTWGRTTLKTVANNLMMASYCSVD